MAAPKRLWTLTASLQVLATFAILVLAGDVTASAYSADQARLAHTQLEAAHNTFLGTLNAAVADGTPEALVAPIRAQEEAAYSGRAGAPSYFVDRVWLNQYGRRAGAVQAFQREVKAVEVQAEVEINTRVSAVLGEMTDDVAAARALDLDVTDYQAFLDSATKTAATLKVPAAGNADLDAAKARDEALKQATSEKKAANAAAQAAADAAAQAAADEAARAAAALASARADASAMVTRAQTALAQARAIPVLDVQSYAADIQSLVAGLPKASSTADFVALAASLRADAAALENLVFTRNLTDQLIQAARASLAKDVSINLPVTTQGPALDAAAQSLTTASTLAAIQAIRNQVQAIKNDLDFQYYQATVLAAAKGKLILVSIGSQELKAMQDGVVLLDTIVATGRPALPTPTGTFSITAKYSPYRMVSPWPPGSPYYYPPVWMSYAMLWHDGGYFLHDAPWRTVWGPNANYISGTHGCINVPIAGETWLYNWAPVGTTVTVIQDKF